MPSSGHTCTYLQPKQRHSDDADPAVKRVEIGDGLCGQVMRVEDGDEAEDGAGQREGVQAGVQDLHAPLATVDEHSVDQDGCNPALYITCSSA